MTTYIDTSALLRLVEGRGDYSLVEAALRNEPTTSELAELECWSSIHKRWHEGTLSRGQRDRLLRTVHEKVLSASTVLTVDRDALSEARAAALRFPLKSLDAIHLGTALVASRRLRPLGHGMRFCTADVRQADAARGLLGSAEVDLVPPL